MMKNIRSKIWVKIIALTLAGIFSVNGTAYARHYSPDKNIEQFFKNDLDQGLMYLGGTVLSIAVPTVIAGSIAGSAASTAAAHTANAGVMSAAAAQIGPVLPQVGSALTLASNAGTAAASSALTAASSAITSVATSTVISGATNIGVQGAVAAGADPKLATVIGGVVGGLTSGSLNLVNAPAGLSTGAQAWTVAIPTVTWTANAAASTYAGAKNPLLGITAGMAAGMASNAAMQNLAYRISGIYFSADGKPHTTAEAKILDARIEALIKIDEKIAKQNSDTQVAGVAEELTMAQTVGKDMNAKIPVPAEGLQIDPRALQAQIEKGNAIIMRSGDIWRALDGKPIVEHGFLGGIKEAFRTISPGQWTSMAVSAAVYEGLRRNGNSNSALLAQLGSSFAGNMAGGLVNQIDGFGIWYTGGTKTDDRYVGGIQTDDRHSIWYNPNYSFTESLSRNAIYSAVDYGFSKINVAGDRASSPITKLLVNGVAKQVVTAAIAGGVDSMFLTDNKYSKKFRASIPTGLKIEKPTYNELISFILRQGKEYAMESTLPLPGYGYGPVAGYEAAMYARNMVRSFATGADYATMYAYNFANALDSFGPQRLAGSFGDAIFSRDEKLYGKLVLSDDIKETKGQEVTLYKQTQTVGEFLTPKPQLPQVPTILGIWLIPALNWLGGVSGSLGEGGVAQFEWATIGAKEGLRDQALRMVLRDAYGEEFTFIFPRRSLEVVVPGAKVEDTPFISALRYAGFEGLAYAINKNISSRKVEKARVSLNKIYNADGNVDFASGSGENSDKVIVTRKDLSFDRISHRGRFGGPPVTFIFDNVNQDFFNGMELGSYSRNGEDGKAIAQLNYDDLLKKVGSGNKILTAFVDNTLFQGKTRILWASESYLGAGGLPALVYTKQVLPMPNASKGEEWMFYDYRQGRRDWYGRGVNIEAGDKGIRADIPKITRNSDKLTQHLKDMIDKEGPPDEFPDAVYLSLRKGEWKDLSIEEIKQPVNAKRYKSKLDAYKSSYSAGELGSYNSFEIGKYIYNDAGNKVIMLPLYIEKAADRKGGLPWAREIDIFVGEGLHAGEFPDHFIITNFSFSGAKLNPQLLLRQGGYSAVYNYNTTLYSTAKQLAPFNDLGRQTMGIRAQSTEADTTRGFAAFPSAFDARRGYTASKDTFSPGKSSTVQDKDRARP